MPSSGVSEDSYSGLISLKVIKYFLKKDSILRPVQNLKTAIHNHRKWKHALSTEGETNVGVSTQGNIIRWLTKKLLIHTHKKNG